MICVTHGDRIQISQVLFLGKIVMMSHVTSPGKTLLIHLLTVVADHRDHLGVARVLLNNKTTKLGYGLIPNNIFTHNKNFTGKESKNAASYCYCSISVDLKMLLYRSEVLACFPVPNNFTPLKN